MRTAALWVAGATAAAMMAAGAAGAQEAPVLQTAPAGGAALSDLDPNFVAHLPEGWRWWGRPREDGTQKLMAIGPGTPDAYVEVGIPKADSEALCFTEVKENKKSEGWTQADLNAALAEALPRNIAHVTTTGDEKGRAAAFAETREVSGILVMIFLLADEPGENGLTEFRAEATANKPGVRLSLFCRTTVTTSADGYAAKQSIADIAAVVRGFEGR